MPILENKNLRLSIDSASGALLSITDKARDVSYALAAHTFSLTADGRVLFAGANAAASEKTTDGVEFLYQEGDFSAKVRYFLPKEGAFFERAVSFRKNQGQWNADKIVCDSIRLAEPANEIHFHDDQTFWHVPINYFIRYNGGGLYCGLE